MDPPLPELARQSPPRFALIPAYTALAQLPRFWTNSSGLVHRTCSCGCPIKIESYSIQTWGTTLYVLYYNNLAWLLFRGIIPFISWSCWTWRSTPRCGWSRRTSRRAAPSEQWAEQLSGLFQLENHRVSVNLMRTGLSWGGGSRREPAEQGVQPSLLILSAQSHIFFICHIPRVLTNVLRGIDHQERGARQGRGDTPALVPLHHSCYQSTSGLNVLPTYRFTC